MNTSTVKELSDGNALISGELARVIEVFDDELRCDAAYVSELVDQIRRYRGKLLRPRLLLLSGLATGRLQRDHIVLGAVLEMIHMATLVHDDVLDEADVRRRGPTVNRLAGNEGAVLLGDYLISHAYHLCSSLGSTTASRRIAAATNTVCEGELMQIAHRGDCSLSEDAYLEIIRRKTAALTSVATELGAATSLAAPDIVRQMAEFGMDLGIAFQIVDDLLDLNGNTGETGKTMGRDAEMGKLTLPAIRFLQHASDGQRDQLLAALSDEQCASDTARTILAESDAVEYSMDMARSYAASAVGRLDGLAPSDAKDALAAAAEFVVQRHN